MLFPRNHAEHRIAAGSYEITSPLGAGGMGEVYRAYDTGLKRDVAVKVLPDAFANDPERLARFQREAELLASLNHPNIAAVYGLERSADVTGIVLELVEGETLADVIARGALSLADALPIARQIADALEAAHDKGVVHRDLKPANIKVTPEGKVKVLDFGLAKMLETEVGSSPLSMSPTLSVHATYPGAILGTAAYMSPEQARGKMVDRRTDIWAFGCVLFEMLTGKVAFDPGETVSDAIVSILSREPDWNALPPDTPPHIRTLLRRCLHKDAQKRLPHVGIARIEIDEGPVRTAPAATSATAGRSIGPVVARGRAVGLATAALAAGLAIASVAAWMFLRTAPSSLQPARFTITPSAAEPFNRNGNYRQVAISPDGTHIVYVAGSGETQLMVRAIDQLEPVALRGTAPLAASPFISPDGQWIGFFNGLSGELKKVAISGGPPITLCRYQGRPRGGAWGPDDTIVFATSDPSTGLSSVPAGGGEPKELSKPDPAKSEADHLFPSFLPAGHGVLFTISTAAGSADNAMVAALDLKTGERKTLVRGGSHAVYAETGHLVYASAGTLRAARFDPLRFEMLSDPVPVLEQVSTFATGGSDFDLTRQGTLIYQPGTNRGGVLRSLAWVTRDGREEPIEAPVRGYISPRLSPDGTRVALEIRDQDNDIWILDLARHTLTRLSFNPITDLWPIWMPDGRRIVYGAGVAGGVNNLVSQAADGTGPVERLTTSPNQHVPTSFSPDGKLLVFMETTLKTFSDVMLLRLDGTNRTEPLVQTDRMESLGEISPNGRWLAYTSTESGQPEVYVRPFPNVNAGRWQISTNGGSRPVWSKNGRELIYLSPDGMMAVAVQTAPSFSAGNPVKLFAVSGKGFYSGDGRAYDVSRDGQRFLMIKDQAVTDQRAAPLMLTVVLNWTEELKARLPPK